MLGTCEVVEFSNQTARRLLLSASDCKFELNGQYRCEFADKGRAHAFSDFEKEPSCPAYAAHANVLVEDTSSGSKRQGTVALLNSNDLAEHGRFSCQLNINNEDSKIAASVNVTHIQFADIEGNY